MASDSSISTVALIVALLALVTTIGQVLGQFLATADGYRRCQPSVMGRWAKLTRRKFRWSELRFETIYTTPYFGLGSYAEPYNWAPTRSWNTKTARCPLDGTLSSMETTFCKSSDVDHGNSTELASWVKFIEALHLNSRGTLKHAPEARLKVSSDTQMTTFSASATSTLYAARSYRIFDVKFQQRSWDFVPPEVVRPLAMVDVSDIAVMVRRLGMIWKEFDPTEGNFRGEGNGHTVSSTTVRSMGTVLQISIRDPLPRTYSTKITETDALYIPSENADKMGFGIVPGDITLGCPDYHLGTEDDVLATLRNVVDPSHQAAKQVKEILEINPGWTPAISDIIGFACPMIRQPKSSLVRVPQPAGYAVGLTYSEEGFVVFYRRLKDLVAERDARDEDVPAQTRSILRQYEGLQSRYGEYWGNPNVGGQAVTTRFTAFLDDLHTKHTAATHYFADLAAQFPGSKGFRYTDLMYSHIKHAVSYFPDALERIRASPSLVRDRYGLLEADWIIEGAHIYFDNIPKVVDEMRNRGFDNPALVEEAWLTMMWKAFLWHRCHVMVEGARVPSSHWGSKLPVYIG